MQEKHARLQWSPSAENVAAERNKYLGNGREAERRAERVMIARMLLDPELMQAAERNDDLFSQLMRDAFDRGQVSRSRLASCISASAAQVGRWANKGSAAPVYSRRLIFWSTARLILEDAGHKAPPFEEYAAPTRAPAPEDAAAADPNVAAGNPNRGW